MKKEKFERSEMSNPHRMLYWISKIGGMCLGVTPLATLVFNLIVSITETKYGLFSKMVD